MLLSESLIAEFQRTHLEKFGYAISAEVAAKELSELAELIEITAYTRRDNTANGDVKQDEYQSAIYA